MKKFLSLVIVFVLGLSANAFSQVVKTPESYVGNWDMLIIGTPDGDAKMVASFKMVEGKLEGSITSPKDPSAPATPLTSITVKETGIEIGFSASGYDVTIDLAKKDNDHLEGSLMSMFTVKAVRAKQ